MRDIEDKVINICIGLGVFFIVIAVLCGIFGGC